jgi:S1-C subfamily serine protease
MPLPPEPPLLTPSPFTTSLLGGTMLVAGAQVVPMNPELGQNFGVEEGLLVLKVLPGTPAYRSELRGGDVLLTANEQDLTSARVLQREMNLSAEHEVKLLIVRQKRRQTITLRW